MLSMSMISLRVSCRSTSSFLVRDESSHSIGEVCVHHYFITEDVTMVRFDTYDLLTIKQ